MSLSGKSSSAIVRSFTFYRLNFRQDGSEEQGSKCDDSRPFPEQLLDSDILSISVGQVNGEPSNFLSKLARDIAVTFRPKEVDVSRVSCSFWSPASGEWSRDGCSIRSRNASHITCQCEHLSAYALLVSNAQEDDRVDLRTLGPIWELAFTIGLAFVFALFGTCLAIVILAALRRRWVNRAEPFNLGERSMRRFPTFFAAFFVFRSWRLPFLLLPTLRG